MKAATIYDVARRAGVSHMTVSRYLKGFEGIRPETRERVELALAELKYRPNAAARLLRLAKSNRIGVLADRFDEHGPARVLQGATELAHRNGFLLDVMSVDGLDAESIRSAIEVLQGNQVAGILATAQTTLVRDLLQEQVTGLPEGTQITVLVTSDDSSSNADAGAAAADHLLDLGHRQLGYVAGPEGWIASSGRWAGFRSRVEERGGTVCWHVAGDWSARSGFEAWQHRDLTAPVTGVATANDSMAIGLMSAAAADGLHVPQDLSVIGTDDVPEAAFLLPRLSTVALDFEGEGGSFMAALLGLIGHDTDGAPAGIRAPVLVERDTTTAV